MRLTNEIRDRIIAKVLSAKFDKQTETLNLADFKFADEVYDSIDGISKIRKMPESWFARYQQFTAYFNGERACQNMSAKKLIPYFVHNSGIRFELTHPLTQRRIAMKQERHELQVAKDALRAELTKVLYSVTTDKRLLEIWPEAEKWLPSKSAIYLPANVDVDKLRTLLKPL